MYVPAVTLFHISGKVRVFKSLESAISNLSVRWIRSNVGAQFKKPFRKAGHFSSQLNSFFDCGSESCVYCNDKGVEWIMRDDQGTVITGSTKQVTEYFSSSKKIEFYGSVSESYFNRAQAASRWNGIGAVPCIRKRKAGWHAFRSVSHFNELKSAQVIKEEGEVLPRASRNVANLPNSWDDYSISSYKVKNWKRYRKTQWKKSEPSFRTFQF